jgi:hypothetical protein
MEVLRQSCTWASPSILGSWKKCRLLGNVTADVIGREEAIVEIQPGVGVFFSRGYIKGTFIDRYPPIAISSIESFILFKNTFRWKQCPGC